MRRARTWGWTRTRLYHEPSNDLGPSSPRQSCPVCIIDTPGYDFREGQLVLRTSSGEVDAIVSRNKEFVSNVQKAVEQAFVVRARQLPQFLCGDFFNSIDPKRTFAVSERPPS